MIYAYIRVSTNHQLLANQRYEISAYAAQNKIKISKWIEETVSSRTDMEERKLSTILQQLKKGDILIASELSRFGRNLLQVMSILHECMDKNCQVWTIKENYKLGVDIQSKVLAFAFGLSAEIERQLISQRTRESLGRVRSEGRKLGRPYGSTSSQLDVSKRRIAYLIRIGVSKAEIARIYGVHWTTMSRFIKDKMTNYDPDALEEDETEMEVSELIEG